MRLICISEAINQKQLRIVAQELNINPTQLQKYIEKADPDRKASTWILKQLRQRKLRLPEDGHRLKQALETFEQVKPRLPATQRNINQYQTLHRLEEVIEPIAGTGSKRSGALQVNPESLSGVRLIHNL